METTKFERSTVNQVRLHVCPTEQFKTYAISVYIGLPLKESSVTSVALIPFVLRRGTEQYPETKQFREKLDDLYGAGFGIDIYKRGNAQILQFRLDIIDDRMVENDPTPMLREAMAFLGGVICRPALEGNGFRAKYVEAEKDTLTKRLESIINDKIRYAAERCIQEMCRNEPYRLNPLGRLEDIPSLEPEGLYAEYQELLAKAPIDIYVSGPAELPEVEALVREYFPLRRVACPDYAGMRGGGGPAIQEPREVVERLDVSQGKLNLGLRAGVTYADEDYPVALMYNGILGGYPHSKLFLNVREKASLAYYASSRLDGHIGILTIQSGIEFANYGKAVEIIQRQLEEMREGKVSELELGQTRSMIRNQLKEMQDSAFDRLGYDFNTVLSGRDRTLPELLAAVERVQADAIQRFAERVELDTIYYLCAPEGGDNG